MASTQREMMPRILGLLLESPRILNVGDIHRQTHLNHDSLVRCLAKMESFGLIVAIPSGFGFNSITAIVLPELLKRPSLV